MDFEMLVALISFASLVVTWIVVPNRGEERQSAEVTAPVAKQATA